VWYTSWSTLIKGKGIKLDEILPFFLYRIFDFFLKGLVVTLELGALAILLGMVFGVVLAIGRVYGGTPISQVIAGYVDVIRGLPVMVVIFIVYLGVAKFIDLDSFTSALVALVVRSSAFQCMAFVGAIQSVSSGQMMAAEALGFSKLGSLRHVVLPQALRFALPIKRHVPSLLCRCA